MQKEEEEKFTQQKSEKKEKEEDNSFQNQFKINENAPEKQLIWVKSPKHAVEHIKLIRKIAKMVTAGFPDLSYEIKKLRFDFVQFKQTIDESADPLWRQFKPRVQKLDRFLKKDIPFQAGQKQLYQNELILIEKDNQEMRELVILCQQKLARMEEQVGNYGNYKE